jgi:hypothetical protein
MVNQFDFKGVEKALSDGIIPAVTLPAHAGLDAMVVQKRSVTVRGVLTASITMRDQTLGGFSFLEKGDRFIYEKGDRFIYRGMSPEL